LNSSGSHQTLSEHFLTRFAEAYVAEVNDFVQSMLNERLPRVSGEDGLKALEIAVAAENSHLQSRPCRVEDGHSDRRGTPEIARKGR
jgi:predicted dehydrogenase